MVVFPALLLLLFPWLGQALAAYRQAVRRGSPAGGELQVVAPARRVVAVTVFWLVGGSLAAPATTLGRMCRLGTRQQCRGGSAVCGAHVAGADRGEWTAQTAYLERAVTSAAIQYGPLAGLDPSSRSTACALRSSPPLGRPVRVAVELVRRQRVERCCSEIIPTATQETVVVEQLGTIDLALYPTPRRVWRVKRGRASGSSIRSSWPPPAALDGSSKAAPWRIR